MEKYMAFMIGNQFINKNLSNLVNYLPKHGFYYIENEFGPNNLELITKKVYIPMIIWMILMNSKKKGYYQ